VSYAEAGWAEGLGPVDVLLDGVGGEVGRQAFAALRDGGRVWRPGMASGTPAQVSDEELAARHAVVTEESPPSPDERRALERETLRLGQDGVLRATIGQRFPLARAADAHAAIEARTTVGKTLLDVAMA
jgi:NADPH2:quinone reductase